MFRTALIAVAVLVSLVAFTPAAPQRSDDPKEGSGADPDFAGKVLVVSVREPAQGGVLQKVKIQRLGGRAFLVGEYIKWSADDHQPEENIWFPVDDIELIREFKSFEEVRKYFGAHGK
jgi:hypothetical protein